MSDLIYQTESGWGSVTFSNIEEPAMDRGFGDPVEDSEVIYTRDTYYGSPFDGSDIGASLYGYTQYGDDGGEFLKIFGLWNQLVPAPALSPTGPFLVSVIDSNGFEKRCYSALAGLGYACLTDASQRILKASLPVLSVGTYDVKVSYGENYATSFTLEDAVEIIPANRSFAPVSISKAMPSFYNTIKNYDAKMPTDFSSLPPLQALTRAIGEEIDKLQGQPYTLLTEKLSVGDSEALVESTLGLPDSGVVFIGNLKFFYSSKTNTSLQGLVLFSARRTEVDEKAKVMLDIYNSESGNDSK